jgi:hypothetical protein
MYAEKVAVELGYSMTLESIKSNFFIVRAFASFLPIITLPFELLKLSLVES